MASVNGTGVESIRGTRQAPALSRDLRAAQGQIVAVDTPVHDHLDAGGLRAQRLGFVDNALLPSQPRQLERDTGIDDRYNLFGIAEYVHQVDRFR